MNINIVTDGKWKHLKSGNELPRKWRKEFDYLTNAQYSDVRFAYYNKRYYDVSEFMRFTGGSFRDKFSGWDGYFGMTYFSGVVIKLDKEKYKIGQYYYSDS